MAARLDEAERENKSLKRDVRMFMLSLCSELYNQDIVFNHPSQLCYLW